MLTYNSVKKLSFGPCFKILRKVIILLNKFICCDVIFRKITVIHTGTSFVPGILDYTVSSTNGSYPDKFASGRRVAAVLEGPGKIYWIYTRQFLRQFAHVKKVRD